MNSIRAVIEYNLKGVVAYMADENLDAIENALKRVEEITRELDDALDKVKCLEKALDECAPNDYLGLE